ncbi:HD domain-containing protein [Candidatus Gracilibacteria bacterium]|nr:HD domain-containing protein [Candidatus Gracilibacteria bacterium]
MPHNSLTDAAKMQEAMRLKFTYRYSKRLKGEQESVAAHSWSMILVADYLLAKLERHAPGKYILDRAKIYSLIAYHDLIEAETGDEDVDPSNQENHKNKHTQEDKVFQSFLQKLPQEIQSIYENRHLEYEARETLESKFVKIVDCIEAEFFCYGKGYLFKNWSKDFHESIRYKHFSAFPELKYIIQDMIHHFDETYYQKQIPLC